MRHPGRWAASLAVIAMIGAGALVALAGRARRGTGIAPGVVLRAGLSPVFLAQTSAHGYNPFGTGPEDQDEIGNVVDSDPNTTWSTEQYYDGTLSKPGGAGTGLYLDAAPGVAGKAIEIQTPSPGFAVQIYVANHIQLSLPYGDSTPLTARGWQGPVGQSTYVYNHARIDLAAGGGRFRYYLIWLTTLPPHMETASIAGVTLFD
jgi:serine/threonine-protein kinase